MVLTGDGLFSLREQTEAGLENVGEPLGLDAFVRFVDGLGPPKPSRLSKYDVAFARQLVKKTP